MSLVSPVISGLINNCVSSVVGGASLNQLLSVSFLDTAAQDWPRQIQQTTDYYQFDDITTALDNYGNVFEAPKHYLAVNGAYTVRNLLDGEDWTDTGNWSEIGATIEYAGDGVMDVAGLSDASSDQVNIPVLSGVSVTDRVFGYVASVKGEGDDVGKDIRLGLTRQSGGSVATAAVTVTLTDEYQDIFVGPVTGLASNTGMVISVVGAPSNRADACKIKNPTPFEWRTGQDTTAPPLPEWLAVDTPMGAELSDDDPDDASTWLKQSGGTGSDPVVTAEGDADKIVFDAGAGGTLSDRSIIYPRNTLVVGRTYATSFLIKAATPSDVGKTIVYRSAGG